MLSFNLSLTHLNRKGEELTNRGEKDTKHILR